MHHDQLDVPLAVVRELVDAQFPEWRRLPIAPVASQGTVNAIFRVGDRYAARFPLQPKDIADARIWLESEAEAARELLGRSRFPTPEPIGIGEPGAGYPLPWSVQTWIPGDIAADHDPGDSPGFALDLAEFIGSVRAIPTRGGVFGGRGRGGDLGAHEAWMSTCFAESGELFDVPRLRRLWAGLRDLPHDGTADVMNHGDLIPGNVLVKEGRLAGVLDVGGLGPADPALDLVSAWHLLEAAPRAVLREALGCGDLEWERGKAWAFQQAMGAAWYYVETNPPMSLMGRRTIRRILADS
ncbi:phosphotransferase [Glycomyces harbinensis]